jgi:hypothetical protein
MRTVEITTFCGNYQKCLYYYVPVYHWSHVFYKCMHPILRITDPSHSKDYQFLFSIKTSFMNQKSLRGWTVCCFLSERCFLFFWFCRAHAFPSTRTSFCDSGWLQGQRLAITTALLTSACHFRCLVLCYSSPSSRRRMIRAAMMVVAKMLFLTSRRT